MRNLPCGSHCHILEVRSKRSTDGRATKEMDGWRRAVSDDVLVAALLWLVWYGMVVATIPSIQ